MATNKKRPNISKRQGVSSGRPRSYSELYKGDTTRTAVTPTVGTTPRRVVVAREVAPAVANRHWRDEYTYVAGDLAKLGIVSAILFGVIIISGFFF